MRVPALAQGSRPAVAPEGGRKGMHGWGAAGILFPARRRAMAEAVLIYGKDT